MKRMILFLLILAMISTYAFSEEIVPLKLALKNTEWKEQNPFDREQYAEQQKEILQALRTSGFRPFPIPPEQRNALKSISEILWNGDTTAGSNSKLDLRQVLLYKLETLPGYEMPRSRIEPADHLLTVVRVDPTQFEQQISTESRSDGIGTGQIRMSIVSAGSAEDVKAVLLRDIMSGNMPTEMYLTLHRIENGPGDACLVSVRGDELSEDRVAFIRGNVGVYLSSYYKDFGCMDLACRLDEFLVEQMRKQGPNPFTAAEQAEIDEFCAMYGNDVTGTDEEGLTLLHHAVALGKPEVVEFLVSQGADVNAKDKSDRTPLHAAALGSNVDIILFLYFNKANSFAKDKNGWTPLHLAASGNDIEVFKTLGAHYDALNIDGLTPLHIAARDNENVEFVKFLLSKEVTINANVNVKSKVDDSTPLHLAAGNNKNIEVIAFLVSNGADVNAKTKAGFTNLSGNTPLHWAAYSNENPEVAKYLLAHGADRYAKNTIGWTPLHSAAHNGNLEVANVLVVERAEINAARAEVSMKDDRMMTPLHLAALRNKNVDIIKFLLSVNADIDAIDTIGFTPLHWAALGNRNDEVAQYLVAEGADVNRKNGNGPHSGVAWRIPDEVNDDVTQYFLSRSVDMNVHDKSGWTPLHLAAYQGKNDLVQFLVSEGADVLAKSDNGETPLHQAVFGNGNLELIKYLVSERADVNTRTPDDNFYSCVGGLTPLHRAALGNQNLEVFTYLVSEGADIHEKDKKGMTPLHFAALGNENLEVIKFLVSHGADVCAKGNCGETPLHWAAFGNRNVDIAKYLVAHGADVNPKISYDTGIHDFMRNTPLHWAAYKGNVETARFLVSQGADVNAVDFLGLLPLHRAALGVMTGDFLPDDPFAKMYGLSPLLLAASGDENLGVIKLLVSEGADVNAIEDRFGYTPLHLVVLNAHAESEKKLEIVKFLVSEGADVNAQDREGLTPLDLAKKKNQWAIPKYLSGVHQ